MARLFVAVWPTPEVRAVLAGLTRHEHPALRWVPPERWHVTLRFLGDVDDYRVGALGDVLARTVRRYLPCQAVIGPSTVRLGRGVLAVPVAGLDQLGTAVIDQTRGFGAPGGERSFIGHMTLARGRGGRPIPQRIAGQPLEAGWDVEAVTLVRSHLDSKGPRYEIVTETMGW